MVSYRSNIDRTNLFDVPNYSKLISIVKDINDKPWVRPFCAILVSTGCRVSEGLYLKRGHIKFIDYNNKEIPADRLLLSDIATIQMNFHTEKNKKSKHRIVPIIKNELFLPLVEIIVDYCKNFKFDDTLLFPYTRGTAWVAIKRVIGKDFFPHYLRHANVTNDTRAGVPPTIQRSKFGWTDLRPHSIYSHLNYLDILNEQQKAYGGPSKKEEIISIIDQHKEERNEYLDARNYVAPPISNEPAKLKEMAAHPDAFNSKENIDIVKITEVINELPPVERKNEDKVLEEPVQAILPIDDPNFKPEPRIYKDPMFIGPELIKSNTEEKDFLKVNPAGAHLFEPGVIVKDHVVLITKSDDKMKEIKRKMDPEKVIPIYNPDSAMLKKVAHMHAIRKAKLEAIKKVQDFESSLVAVV